LRIDLDLAADHWSLFLFSVFCFFSHVSWRILRLRPAMTMAVWVRRHERSLHRHPLTLCLTLTSCYWSLFSKKIHKKIEPHLGNTTLHLGNSNPMQELHLGNTTRIGCCMWHLNLGPVPLNMRMADHAWKIGEQKPLLWRLNVATVDGRFGVNSSYLAGENQYQHA
jgi:hypothetical protein